MKKILIGVLILAAVILIFVKKPAGNKSRSIAGIPAPIQSAATGGTSFEKDGYKVSIKYKADYTVEALVLSTHSYFSGSITDKLAPKDLALGWGTVAEYNDRIDFHWSQSGRWYHWRVDDSSVLGPVGGISGVSKQSANNHLIASTETIQKLIENVKTGGHIRITGYLIDLRAEKDDGTYYTWSSSTSRDDTGDGSCELIYVTKFENV
ncbi:MAG: hypothetical protein K6F64_05850 [Clostridia bacterium]|nr:hypothetical protein [Clostridia bacterium]